MIVGLDLHVSLVVDIPDSYPLPGESIGETIARLYRDDMELYLHPELLDKSITLEDCHLEDHFGMWYEPGPKKEE